MSIEDYLRRAVAEELEPVLAEIRSATAAMRSTASRGTHEYLDTDEAAELARVTPATVRQWIKQGRLNRYTAGRRLLVRAAEVHQLLTPGSDDPVDDAVEAELRALRLTKGK